MLKVAVVAEHQLTPEELVSEWWGMDADQQADVFLELVDLLQRERGRFLFQLAYINDAIMEHASDEYRKKVRDVVNMFSESITCEVQDANNRE